MTIGIRLCILDMCAVKGRLHRALSPISAVAYAILTRPKREGTAVRGCHHPGDMAVRMPDHSLVFECVTCFNCLKGVTFVVECVKCVPISMKETR